MQGEGLGAIGGVEVVAAVSEIGSGCETGDGVVWGDIEDAEDGMRAVSE